MTIQEAMEIVEKEIPMYNPTLAIEYSEHFVFMLDEFVFDGSLAVNKKTGKITKYTPLLISEEDLDKGGKKYTVT